MENVLAAVIIIFLILFGTLTLSSAFISAQEIVYDAWEDANQRQNVLSNTRITPQDLRILSGGSQIEMTLTNTGSVKLADFQQWDVFVDYFDSALVPNYYTARLTFDANAPAMSWLMTGIFLDAAAAVDEVFEPEIFNTGEALVLRANVSPAVGAGQMARLTVSTPNGVSTSLAGIRNIPPVLATVDPTLRIASGSTVTLLPAALETTDADNQAAELIYTIDVPPQYGTLEPDTFSQEQIDAGEVTYSHAGTEPDSFTFRVSDGTDEIGAYVFVVTINAPPVVSLNTGATGIHGETTPITSAMLQAADADDDGLIFIVTQSPVNGTLSLGAQFSQEQIDSGELTYAHTNPDADADLFSFVVSDGYDVTSAYTFHITHSPAPDVP